MCVRVCVRCFRGPDQCLPPALVNIFRVGVWYGGGVINWQNGYKDTHLIWNDEENLAANKWACDLGGHGNECSSGYASRAAVKNKEELMGFFFSASSCDATCCIFNPSHALLKHASDDEPQSQGRTLRRISNDFLLISDERKDSLREQVGLVTHVNRQMG